MRKVIKPKIKYRYMGDESHEAKKEAQKILDDIFLPIFDKIAKDFKVRKSKT